MTSSKPYFLRAFYEWLVDNDKTPYVLVAADITGVRVPQEHVRNGQIVLNMSPTAVDALFMRNEGISFCARFGGVARDIFIPINALIAIYGKEDGEGIAFSMDGNETQPISFIVTQTASSQDSGTKNAGDKTEAPLSADADNSKSKPSKKPNLTLVK